ncbi:MAG: STAS domain-containing protein [Algibacter sp.]
MNFQIINNKGVFEVCGDFTNTNTDEVANYFDNLLDTYYEIVICLKKVKQIDESALSVMQCIANKAKKRSKILFVLGKENKSIKGIFNKANLTSIFRNDYNH